MRYSRVKLEDERPSKPPVTALLAAPLLVSSLLIATLKRSTKSGVQGRQSTSWVTCSEIVKPAERLIYTLMRSSLSFGRLEAFSAVRLTKSCHHGRNICRNHTLSLERSVIFCASDAQIARYRILTCDALFEDTRDWHGSAPLQLASDRSIQLQLPSWPQ